MDNKILKKDIFFVILLVMIVSLMLIAIYLNIERGKLAQTIKNTYFESFMEFVDYMDNVETLLAKAQITSSPEYSAKTLNDIWRKADLAEGALSKVPITHISIENAQKFLNQVSDYSYYLSQKTIENEPLNASELENISNMYDRCKTLNQTLSNLVAGLNDGGISFKELQKNNDETFLAQEVSANISQDSFGKIEEDMQDYEGLIYDGPFSEHMTNPNILGLGDEEYTKEMAENVIYEYVEKRNVKNILYNGMVSGNIECYSFNVTLNNDETMYIDITKKGGKVIWFSVPREISDINLSKEAATKIAVDFLNNHGFTNMKESYFTNDGGMLTINYAYEQDGIICYTDLIKVKVALDNGDIVGMESKSYLSSHHERKMSEPKISIEEARAKINSNLEIISSGRAVIPTDFQTELEVYEFKGKTKDNNFIVYINIETGKEEKIFIIIDTPGGELAV